MTNNIHPISPPPKKKKKINWKRYSERTLPSNKQLQKTQNKHYKSKQQSTEIRKIPVVSFKKVYYDKRCTSLNSKKLHACSQVLNYSCPLILQISYLASTLPSLSNCNWFSKKEAFGVFQFTSCLSRYQKTNLSCSAGHIYLPPPGTCPYRWPHASVDSNGLHTTAVFHGRSHSH